MKKIKFEYINEYAWNVCERPKPSSSYIPEWFQKMPPYERSAESNNGKKFIFKNGVSNASAKKCTPMRDAITGGYTVPLWADVYISSSSDQLECPEITWRVAREVFTMHGVSALEMDCPPGYNKNVFKYITYFRIRTPPGYSVIVKPPAGHYDLPIVPVTAVVDSDKSVIDSNIPCWVKNNFDGIVEKGTPIAQIFPFKRESWEIESYLSKEDSQFYESEKFFNTSIKDNYIKNIWSKKIFK